MINPFQAFGQPAPVAPAPAPALAADTAATHTVKAGETLAEIAQVWGHSGETAALWDQNVGQQVHEDGSVFGSFDHAQSGGNPRAGWVLRIPVGWTQPPQPEPRAVKSDAEQLAETLTKFKELAAKLGISL